MAELVFNYGAMNSGKSTQIIQAIYNYEERGLRVLLIKPKIDTKGDETIISRAGLSRKVDILLNENESLLAIYHDYLKDQTPWSYTSWFLKLRQEDLPQPAHVADTY